MHLQVPPLYANKISSWLKRAAIDHEICFFFPLISLRDLYRFLLGARYVDGETTNGHSRLHCLQRTLMEDARQGLQHGPAHAGNKHFFRHKNLNVFVELELQISRQCPHIRHPPFQDVAPGSMKRLVTQALAIAYLPTRFAQPPQDQ